MTQTWEVVKEVTQPTRRRAQLSVEALAYLLRVSPSEVYKWGQVDSGRRFPAEMVGPVTKAEKDRLLIEHLCRECDGVFIPLPSGTRDVEMLNGIVKEFSQALEAWAAATSAGGPGGENWTLAEADKFRAECLKVIQAVMMAVFDAESKAREFESANDGRAATLAETKS